MGRREENVDDRRGTSGVRRGTATHRLRSSAGSWRGRAAGSPPRSHASTAQTARTRCPCAAAATRNRRARQRRDTTGTGVSDVTRRVRASATWQDGSGHQQHHDTTPTHINADIDPPPILFFYFFVGREGPPPLLATMLRYGTIRWFKSRLPILLNSTSNTGQSYI